jgi:phosphonatase-like hydrolase
MDLILAQSEWLGAADAIVCGDEVSRGRPAPYMIFRAMELAAVTDVRRVMAVGDTVNDLLAGANAGVAAIVGVLTGSQGWDKLATVAHTHVLRSVAGIPGLIEREFGRV